MGMKKGFCKNRNNILKIWPKAAVRKRLQLRLIKIKIPYWKIIAWDINKSLISYIYKEIR